MGHSCQLQLLNFLANPPAYLDCLAYPPVSVDITDYKLQNNTSLQDFANGQIQRINRTNEDLLFDPKETISGRNSSEISALPVIRIVETSGDQNKQAVVYTVNDNIGYEISFNARTAKYFPYFLPTFEKILNSLSVIDLG